MNFSTTPSKTPDVSALAAAIVRHKEPGSLGAFLERHYWSVLGAYTRPMLLQRGHLLIAQGDTDRNIYFIESGNLKVDMRTHSGLVQLAIIGPGNVAGEGSFFSHQTRTASVSVYSDCKVWEMTPANFESLSKQHPAVALALAMALGAVLASRMLDISNRIALT